MAVSSSKRKYIIIVLICFLLAAGSFYGLSTTSVPDFKGKNLDEAWEVASSHHLELKVTFKSDLSTKGTILSQEPLAGKRVRRGSTVKILVSQGFRQAALSSYLIKVPSVVGLSLTEASQRLEEKGFTASVSEKESSAQKGMVITQYPPGGERLPRGYQILLVVSRGEVGAGSDSGSQVDSELTICIDPGHQAKANLQREPIGPGSSETKEKCRGGASGVVTGSPEHKITLQIALKLESLLKERGFRVVMTRQTSSVNISNAERAQIANRVGAALFIRIHCDGSVSSSTHGVSTLYPSQNQWTGKIYRQSKKAARIIQEELVRTTGQKDKGIVSRGDITGFNWSRVPVVLVEAGFLSNPEEDRLLGSASFQWKVAQGLEKGIVKFLRD